jgi:hypothetical protein
MQFWKSGLRQLATPVFAYLGVPPYLECGKSMVIGVNYVNLIKRRSGVPSN